MPRLFIHLPKHRLSFFLTKNIHALVTSQASEWHSFNIHWTLSLLEYFYDSLTGLGSNPGPDIMLLNETVNGLSFTHYEERRRLSIQFMLEKDWPYLFSNHCPTRVIFFPDYNLTKSRFHDLAALWSCLSVFLNGKRISCCRISISAFEQLRPKIVFMLINFF